MPPLPPLPAGVELEEPHAIGPDARSFSPQTMMVRNNSLGTPTLATRSDASQVSGITGSIRSDRATSESLMLRTYSDTVSSHVLTKHDKTNIVDTAKKYLLGRLKFIQSADRKFPSFWQPDLLGENAPVYVDELFETYGAKYKDRKSNDAVLIQAAELWKAAAPVMKKLVDNHRAGVAQKMKADIMTGEIVFIYNYSSRTITLSSCISSSLAINFLIT